MPNGTDQPRSSPPLFADGGPSSLSLRLALGHRAVIVSANAEDLIRTLALRFGPCVDRAAAPPGGPTLRVQARLSDELPRVPRGEGLASYASTDGYTVTVGDGVEYYQKPGVLGLIESRAGGRAELVMSPQPAEAGAPYRIKGEVNWEDAADVLVVLLARWLDEVCLHAAAVAADDRALLLTGPSGSGKTTTALALRRKGLELLSDEICLLRRAGDGTIGLAGLPLAPRLCCAGPASLEGLAAAESGGCATEKVYLPSAVAGHRAGRYVRPAAIVLLRGPRPGRANHDCERIRPEAAFEQLMGQVLDPAGAARVLDHTEVLAGLVRDCPAWVLGAGSDLDSLAELLEGILSASPQCEDAGGDSR